MELDGIEVDPIRWPDDLQTLVPFIEAWARSDDQAREERIAGASDEALSELVGGVQPHFPAINEYLDATDNEENALPLGTLAEAAMEAQFELDRRESPSPPEDGANKCSVCGGDGFIRRPHPTIADGWIPDLCVTCGGTGRAPQ